MRAEVQAHAWAGASGLVLATVEGASGKRAQRAAARAMLDLVAAREQRAGETLAAARRRVKVLLRAEPDRHMPGEYREGWGV